MGVRSSKKSFNEWDLVGFSNLTGIPLEMVEKIYKDFSKMTGNDNKMDKTEFRRLFKKLYIDSQATSLPSALPPFFSSHELNKMADHVFETYDYDGTGKLTFEEFAEAYLMLTHHPTTSKDGTTFRDRINYILDQHHSTPGFITREQGEHVFNRLNKYSSWTSSKGRESTDSLDPNTIDWDSHWTKLDDGSDCVPKEKFMDYITTSNDYKHHFESAAT